MERRCGNCERWQVQVPEYGFGFCCAGDWQVDSDADTECWRGEFKPKEKKDG